MKRILHVVSSTFTGSGVMHFLMNYYRNIDKKKYQFDFLCLKKFQDCFDDEIKKMGGKVHYLDDEHLKITSIKKINQILEENNYNIIHCHPIFSFLMVGNYAKKNGLKIIQHSHTNKLSNKKISYIRNYLILKLSPFYVDKYCACSEEALSLFSKKDLEKKGSVIINNSIDYSKYKFNNTSRKKIRDKYNITENDIVIGHVGRFSKEKNHKLILNVFEELLKTNENYKLIFVGDGELKSKIFEMARSKKIDNKIIFTGNVSKVEEYLCAIDIFLFPSSFEGFGLALLEAQLSGLMCITSYNVPNDAIITNYVTRCDLDEKDILNNIKLIDIKKDRNNIKIENCDYNIENNVKKIEKFYELLLK